MGARLQDVKRVTLDSNGYGIIRFGPGRPREIWTVQRVTCQVSSNTKEAQFKLYRGNVSSAFLSGSVSGSTGDTDDGLNEMLNAGEFLTGEWSGGDAAATATLTYWGNIDIY